MKKNLLVTGLISTLLSNIVYADETLNLDLLSAEASKTEMSNVQSNKPNAIEPAVKPNPTMDIDGLSDYISDQLAEVLKAGDTIDEKETEAKLENIVSSALLGGIPMKDLRLAVATAMNDIKETQKDEKISEKITQTSESLNKLMVESKQDQPTQSKQKDKSTITTSTTDKPPKTIIVLKGESLYKIALRVYGRGDDYLRLYNANKDTIVDPNIIHVGQVLRIP